MAKDGKIEYVEVEGIKCEIKNPKRKAISQYYQESLRGEIDNYIGSIDRWSESSRAYRDSLKINVIIAPFVLGWLRKPEDEDEYLVIKGYMTLEELQKKRDKASGKKVTRKRKPAVKKAEETIIAKKPVAPKKPTVASIAKKPATKGLTKGPVKAEEKAKPAIKKTVTTRKSAIKNGATKGPVKGSAKPTAAKPVAKKPTVAKKVVAKKQDSPIKKAASPKIVTTRKPAVKKVVEAKKSVITKKPVVKKQDSPVKKTVIKKAAPKAASKTSKK